MTTPSLPTLHFIGCGAQFASRSLYQSNLVLTAPSGRRMLVDCGSDVKHALAEAGLRASSVEAVYISHLHSDHVGGMEWLAYSTYFNPNAARPRLYGHAALLDRVWTHTLRGGLRMIEGRCMELSDYFDCRPVGRERAFGWEGLGFELVEVVHVTAPPNHAMVSCGLYLGRPTSDDDPTPRPGGVLYTSDTQFTPRRLAPYFERAELILHDCETGTFQTPVHAHYDQLCTLPAAIKAKTWLYHYQDDNTLDARDDGFAGFVRKGQVFSLDLR